MTTPNTGDLVRDTETLVDYTVAQVLPDGTVMVRLGNGTPPQPKSADRLRVVRAASPAALHNVVVRGGHSLYCADCDRDVYRVTAKPADRLLDRDHVAEVRRLIRPEAWPQALHLSK